MAPDGTYDFEENQLFVNANRINSANFNMTTLKLTDKLDQLFSHIFLFGNIFAQGHGFDAVTHQLLIKWVMSYSLKTVSS